MKLPYMPSTPIFSLAASRSRANPTPWPGSGGERLTNVISGRTPLESFGMWDQDSSCWRTFQASLLTGMAEPWSGSFPTSGMTAFGTASLLRPLVPRTSVGGGGALRYMTPNAMDSLPAKSQDALDYEHSTARPGRKNPNNLRDQVSVEEGTRLWPTPASRHHKDGDAHSCQNVPVNGLLVRVVHRLPTPSSGGDSGGPHGSWPTPCYTDHGGATKVGIEQTRTGFRRTSQTTGTQYGASLTDAVELMNGGSLNPDWVSWLMGLPVGWTSLEPLSREEYLDWFHAQQNGTWWQEERGLPRVAQGVKDRVGRLKALGNGIVPAVVAKFLTEQGWR